MCIISHPTQYNYVEELKWPRTLKYWLGVLNPTLDQPFRVCLVEWILGRMKEEDKKKNQQQQLLFGECLAGRGREENDSGVHVLSLWAHQKVLSLKWGENWVGGVW